MRNEMAVSLAALPVGPCAHPSMFPKHVLTISLLLRHDSVPHAVLGGVDEQAALVLLVQAERTREHQLPHLQRLAAERSVHVRVGAVVKRMTDRDTSKADTARDSNREKREQRSNAGATIRRLRPVQPTNKSGVLLAH